MTAVLKQEAKEASSTSHTNRPVGGDVTHVGVELGIWLSSLESFVQSGPTAFFLRDANDRGREAHIVHSALLRSSMLTAMLLDPGSADPESNDLPPLAEIAKTLRDLAIFSASFLHGRRISTAEYNVLSKMIVERLKNVSARDELIGRADRAGAKNLPVVLLTIVDDSDVDHDLAELAIVLPRFGQVLRYLDVVGGMLERDEPLKPSILIFSRVNEMIYELTMFISNRLERFPDVDAEIFAALDAASYTASMELKKVYNQELAGVVETKQAPSVFARTETAYALLHDSFQLILAGFARMVDPTSDMFRIYPEFNTKRERSLTLRKELLDLIRAVQAAEDAPEDRKIESLKSQIREFMIEPARYLFYKDTETVERFVEEIASTRSNSDLVPLLHRFGAYLDTLLGQVSLRAVLADPSS